MVQKALDLPTVASLTMASLNPMTEPTVIAFDVKDMTCGHCARAITQAVQAADPAAQVSVDLALKRVQVEPGAADAARLQQAIADAGYTPVQAEAAVPAATARSGCCCGGGGCR